MLATLSNFAILMLVIGGLVVTAMLVWLVYMLTSRDRISTLRRIRIGVFLERDTMRPEDMPKPEPWVHPTDDPTLYELTEEKHGEKRTHQGPEEGR